MRPEDKLITAGLKVTAPRLRVLQVFLADTQALLTAESVYLRMLEQGCNVARSTVYRVLTTLTDVGLLSRNAFVSTTAVYQLSKERQRDHLVCLGCGEIAEFADDAIDGRLTEVALNAGYTIVRRQLTLHGFCAACRAKSADVRPAGRRKA